MRRLWLIFAQAVTISVALLFVVNTLKPEWMRGRIAPTPVATVRVETAARPPAVETAGIRSYAEAAKRALPSVVHIYTRQTVKIPNHPLMDDSFRRFLGAPERNGLGSGVIAGTEGYVLTNNHVIEGADEIEVVLNDERKFSAKLIGRDPETDLAVLKLDAGDTLPAIAFAPADSLTVGDPVLAIGNPFGIGQTVTMGIASALGRDHLGINTFENYIQTDAAINPGNSGGALIDSAGRLVGINTAIYSRSGSSLGIGFAIPVSTARKVLEQIIAHGEVVRGWVGVEMREITPEHAATFGLPESRGVLIRSVLRGSPADKGSIQPGDILLAIDGHRVQEPRSMLDLVASLPPGQTAVFLIRRNDEEIEQKIVVGRRPTPASAPR
ncbi:MAG: trypsin-like peptidase domain-containing protein [Azoarcus sp.]|jgi:serine protease DegS/serine protease DegQ|nr:trypsin-like peptidase domain-containing protein [Azoarcus sp.]